MDPNANLQQQQLLINETPRQDADGELYQLRHDLSAWMRRGGFQPNWDAYPEATKEFRLWHRFNY